MMPSRGRGRVSAPTASSAGGSRAATFRGRSCARRGRRRSPRAGRPDPPRPWRAPPAARRRSSWRSWISRAANRSEGASAPPAPCQIVALLLHRELLLRRGGPRLRRGAHQLLLGLGGGQPLLVQLRGEGGVVELHHLLPRLDRRAVLLHPADLELPASTCAAPPAPRPARRPAHRSAAARCADRRDGPSGSAPRSSPSARSNPPARRPCTPRRRPRRGRQGDGKNGFRVDEHFLESVYERTYRGVAGAGSAMGADGAETPKSTFGAVSAPGCDWKYGRGWKPIIEAMRAVGKRWRRVL